MRVPLAFAPVVFVLVFVLVAGLVAAPAGPARAGLMDGLAAYGAGAYPRAYALLKPHAQRGVPEAQFRVGWILAEGRAGRLAIGRGLAWLDRAYRGGHDRGGLAYATIVVRERLDGPAAARAETIFLALIACGMPAAMTNYAYWLGQRSNKGPQIEARRFDLFEKAALLGSSVAQLNLGRLYLRQTSTVEGFAWIMIAAENGNESARSGLRHVRGFLIQSDALSRIEERAKQLAATLSPQAAHACHGE